MLAVRSRPHRKVEVGEHALERRARPDVRLAQDPQQERETGGRHRKEEEEDAEVEAARHLFRHGRYFRNFRVFR